MSLTDPENGFEIMAGGNLGLLLICDHASSALPPRYGSLGLAAGEFERHIAYDIGAREVTLGLAAKLDCPAVLSRYSRLLIDPNRGLDDPTLIMKLSDGAVVPGNADIDEAERRTRIENIHAPYHRAIDEAIDQALAAGAVPALISVHSFTPTWKGGVRPWHAGILWDRDRRLAAAMLAGLTACDGIMVGDNEPYSGALEGDTMSIHATARGLAHVLTEIRQDLIAHKSGVDEWAGRLARVIEPIMNDPAIHRIEPH